MTRPTGLILAVLCAVATLGPAAAQDPSPGMQIFRRVVPTDRALTPAEQLAYLIPPGGTLVAFREQLRAMFRPTDADGDGVLTEADASLHRAVFAANWVATWVTQIMIADLDGDGFVTEAELRRKLRYDVQIAPPFGLPRPPSVQGAGDPDRRIQREVAQLMAADTDHDGRISWTEAAAFARSQPAPARYTAEVEWRMKVFEGLAPGKDRIALADLDGLAEVAFREFDTDHDGTVSRDELAAWYKRQNR